MTISQFWHNFLIETQQDVSTTYVESFHFELNEKLANELLTLVLNGKKQATASSLLAYTKQNCRIPKVGDYNIITDWDGLPHCVIQTTAITILPFEEITYEICKREGEDDNLASWQHGHRTFFINEGKILGYQFSEDMPVIFEDFEVVYRR